jgi:5-formyltetrahydrofolate cyclo-ligase
VALRRELRAVRRRIGGSERRAAGLAIARRLLALPIYRRAQHIAAYWPADGEIDPLPALALAHAAGKCCYLPVLHPARAGHLGFAPWRPKARLLRNRFGIAEPVGPRQARIEPRALDLVLVPLVGFDMAGSRLGMGGGFYDRSFAFALRPATRRPRLVGVAFDCQRVGSLPARPWDVPLDGVVTPRAYHRFGAHRSHSPVI